MSAEWHIDALETTEGSSSITAHWRAEDGPAMVYGAVIIDGITITSRTLEQEIVESVKRALNAIAEQRDEHGNLTPPLPGEETAKTDAIEASLAAQIAEIAHPKTKQIKLPWVA